LAWGASFTIGQTVSHVHIHVIPMQPNREASNVDSDGKQRYFLTELFDNLSNKFSFPQTDQQELPKTCIKKQIVTGSISNKSFYDKIRKRTTKEHITQIYHK